MSEHDDGVAVRVDNVYKAFGGQKARWLSLNLPWRRNVAAEDGDDSAEEGDSITVAVDHLSFEIDRGEIFGVLGPNGSGKSTLIRLMATLLIPDEGSITVFGHDVVEESMTVSAI